MKEFLKKSWQYFLIVPVIIAVIAGIFLNLPQKEEELTIMASDINIKVDEKAKIICELSIKEAESEFFVEDKNVASVVDDEVYGVSVGHTTLKIVATFRNSRVTKEVNVMVFDEENNTQDDTQETPSEDTDTPSDENISPETPSDDITTPSDEELEEKEYIIVKCGFQEVDFLEFQLGQSKVISILTNVEFEIEKSDGIFVEEIGGVEGAFKVTASKEGEFEIKFISQNIVKIIKVKVELFS